MTLTVDSEKCAVPCEGLYADIEKSTDFTDFTESEALSKALIDYEDFKSGFDKKQINSRTIAGMLV